MTITVKKESLSFRSLLADRRIQRKKSSVSREKLLSSRTTVFKGQNSNRIEMVRSIRTVIVNTLYLIKPLRFVHGQAMAVN